MIIGHLHYQSVQIGKYNFELIVLKLECILGLDQRPHTSNLVSFGQLYLITITITVL